MSKSHQSKKSIEGDVLISSTTQTMKLYKIKVNGKSYEVEVESITQHASKPVTKERVVNDENTDVKAPIQGIVIKLNALVGKQVKKGSVLLVLESMKLENDILCPVTGYISQVFVTVGQKVELNQLLLIIG